jgi:hypothetical protein
MLGRPDAASPHVPGLASQRLIRSAVGREVPRTPGSGDRAETRQARGRMRIGPIGRKGIACATQRWREMARSRSGFGALPARAAPESTWRWGRVEDERGSFGHSATLRFTSPLIEPDVPD